MNRTVEVNRRSQVEEYLSEYLTQLEVSWKVGVENGSLDSGVCLTLVERCWDKDKDAR